MKIVGVSMDQPGDLKKFSDKNKFTYPLLSDPEGNLVKAFGVAKLRENICARQSFLVKEGTVIWNDTKAGTADHADDVLKALDELIPTPPPAADKK
ncbi:MAG: peroxiredoxin [Verrucomicrobiales bacterium]